MRWFRLCAAVLAGLTLASAQSPTGKLGREILVG